MSLNEENARITLLGCIMTLYVFAGAIIIKTLESPFEKRLVRNYWRALEEFEQKLLNGTAETEELKSLLYTYGNVTSALGVPGKYERWNFLGSLHFVVTIVTTIGTSENFNRKGNHVSEIILELHGRRQFISRGKILS